MTKAPMGEKIQFNGSLGRSSTMRACFRSDERLVSRFLRSACWSAGLRGIVNRRSGFLGALRPVLFGGILFVIGSAPSQAAHGGMLGIKSLVAGKATNYEGNYSRTVYAPGTDQSILFKGTWSASVSAEGTRISIVNPRNKEERTVSFLGSDQFELLTKDSGFQEAEIRTRNQGSAVGPHVSTMQYILHRIGWHEGDDKIGKPEYALSWNHLRKSIKTDLEHGVSVLRGRTGSAIKDEWYVSGYLVDVGEGDKRSVISPPGYPPTGFLAIAYSRNTGSPQAGEQFVIKEYWPKRPIEVLEGRASDEVRASTDVELYRDTVLSISSVKVVDRVELLPQVSSPQVTLTDFRLPAMNGGEGSRLEFEEIGWVRSTDKAAFGRIMKATVVKNEARDPLLQKRKIIRSRLMLASLILALTIPLIVFARRKGQG